MSSATTDRKQEADLTKECDEVSIPHFYIFNNLDLRIRSNEYYSFFYSN